MERTKCSECGAVTDLIEFDDAMLCPQCYERQTVECEECGDRIWREDAVDGRLCYSCYENHYHRCEGCGAVIHEEETSYRHDYPYCERCYDDLPDEYINEYGYKPDPMFYGDGQPHYGVELEIDNGGESDENAKEIMDTVNGYYEHIYCKHDGSLDNGFEIVSHPATLDYHLHKLGWRNILEKARQLGYTSHSARTCGLHVHINRAALGETVEEQENTIGRIVYFFERFWDKILRFSRRTELQVSRWAARYGCTGNPKETLKKAKDLRLGRYTAVNLENIFTVELRIFRGTLRYDTFAATLQFVDKLCHDAISLSDEQFQTMAWSDFVKSIPQDKKELSEYLKIRGLEE